MSGGRVLIFHEDDRAAAVATGLRALGFATATDADPVKVIQAGRARRADVVICAVPAGSPLALELPQALACPTGPAILVLCPNDDSAARIAALDAGCDDYVTTPCPQAELAARLRALLRRLEPSTEAKPLVLGHLEIDTCRLTVRRDGEPLLLSRTELDLLMELASSPNQIFPHESLVRSVWGYAGDGHCSLALRTTVKRLRRKVEIDPCHPRLVRTARGVGYYLSTNRDRT